MTNKLKIILTGLVVVFIIWSTVMEYVYSTKWLVKSIHDEYNGIIVDTFSTNRSFIFKVLINTKDTVVISSSTLTNEFYNSIGINKFIIKSKNENFVFIGNTEKDMTKVFYEKISHSDRENLFFPKEWKEKWIESSKWEQKQQ